MEWNEKLLLDFRRFEKFGELLLMRSAILDIPETSMTSIFEGQPPKTRPKLKPKQGSWKGSRYVYMFQ